MKTTHSCPLPETVQAAKRFRRWSGLCPTCVFLIPLLFVLAVPAAENTATEGAKPYPKPERYLKDIAAFEAADRTNPPPAKAILMVGSSSIRMWKGAAHDFPQYNVINRGYGGSVIADSVFFADRIVLPYQPRQIIMYAGGNDINAGRSAEGVLADFKAFTDKVLAQLPETRIAYISIAPNPARWKQIETIREANRLIESYIRTQPKMAFINTHDRMLGPDGQPKPDIFLPDRLHMNEKGYAIWKEVVGDFLSKNQPPDRRP